MKKCFFIFLSFFVSSLAFAQYNSGGEYPLSAPTPTVEVPAPTLDFGSDTGGTDFSDYSGVD